MSSGGVTDAKAKLEVLAKFERQVISSMSGGDRRYKEESLCPWKPKDGDGTSAPRATFLVWLMLYREIW